jgi:selenocysteine lyase/cysteine desulfurase
MDTTKSETIALND